MDAKFLSEFLTRMRRLLRNDVMCVTPSDWEELMEDLDYGFADLLLKLNPTV